VRQGCRGPRLTLPGGKGESKPSAGAQVQGGSNGNNNNKKKADSNQPLIGVPTVAVAATGGGHGGPKGNKHPRQSSNSDDGNTKCLVHNCTCHSASECQEIKRLTE
jgi:hypothetical protein